MSEESLDELIKKLMPKNLDDVLRKNRHQMRLALATPGEVEELSADISDVDIRHTLTRWEFVVMHATEGGSPFRSVRLFGWVEKVGESWSTSNVTGIDLAKGMVRTANSVYRITGPRAKEGELDLLHVCASLHNWGLGEHFDVPHIFYGSVRK